MSVSEGDAHVKQESSAQGIETFGVRITILFGFVSKFLPRESLNYSKESLFLTLYCIGAIQNLNQHPQVGDNEAGFRVGVSEDKNRKCRKAMEE